MSIIYWHFSRLVYEARNGINDSISYLNFTQDIWKSNLGFKTLRALEGHLIRKIFLQINESVKNELDELKYEFQLMQGSLSELKNDKKQTIDAINSKLNRKRILYHRTAL